MRTLQIVSGLAVLLTTLHMAHGIHHFIAHASDFQLHGFPLWGGAALGFVVEVFSLIGACLLLRGNR